MTLSMRLAAVFALTATVASAQTAPINSGHLQMLDTDGDGAISKSEYNTFSDFAFKQMDTDKSGWVSQSEFDAQLPGGDFAGVDANGNGSISKSEFSNQMNADFATADKDGDGLLD